MHSDTDNLTIRRTCRCNSYGKPAIRILLLQGESPLIEYFAHSVSDADRYESETIESVRRLNPAFTIVTEDFTQCKQCEHQGLCQRSPEAEII